MSGDFRSSRSSRSARFVGAAAAALVAIAAAPAAMSSAVPQLSQPAVAQDARGQQLYVNRCAACHGRDLGGGVGPALRGKTLFTKKRGATAFDLSTWTRVNMPPTAPLSLSADESLAITARILRANGAYRDPAPLTAATARTVKL